MISLLFDKHSRSTKIHPMVQLAPLAIILCSNVAGAVEITDKPAVPVKGERPSCQGVWVANSEGTDAQCFDESWIMRLYRRGPDANINLSRFIDSSGTSVEGKVAGSNRDCGGMGNPILPSTGNKIEPELDFISSGEFGLYLQRTYNNHWYGGGLFGRRWITNFDYMLTFGGMNTNNCARPGGIDCAIGSAVEISAWRPDGRTIKFIKGVDGVFYEDKPGPVARVVNNGVSGFTLYGEDNSVETYSQYGRIQSIKNERGVGWTYAYNGNFPISVTHTSGRSVQFTWNGEQLIQVRDPAGNVYAYTYLSNPYGYNYSHILATTTKPGLPQTTITYHYELTDGQGKRRDPLTGKSYNNIRFSQFTYDGNERATSSGHNGLEKYTFAYTDGGGYLTTVVTNPLGKQTTYKYQDGKSIEVVGQASAHCPASASLTQYDPNGYPSLRQDNNGNYTSYVYNTKGQLIQQVEAYNTSLARTTNYSWDSFYNRLASVADAGVRTDYSYTGDNRVASVSVTNLQAPAPANNLNQVSTTTYSYTKHANGMLATMTVDGPLPGAGDAVVSSYDGLGNLVSIRNSLGQTIGYSNFNGLGQAGRITNANGDVVDHTYDERARITETKTYRNGATQVTRYGYDGFGRLATVVRADGVKHGYQYDVGGRVLLEYEAEPGGTFAQIATTYNAMSLPTSVTTSRVTSEPASGTVVSTSSSPPSGEPPTEPPTCSSCYIP